MKLVRGRRRVSLFKDRSLGKNFYSDSIGGSSTY
jgi:hypothetical protein